MNTLRLYKIEGLIIDDELTKDILAERLGSFTFSLNVVEVDMTMAAYKEKVPTPAKTSAKKATKKVHRKVKVSSTVQSRIDAIAKAVTAKGLTIPEIVKATKFTFNQVEHACLTGERTRALRVTMVKRDKKRKAVRVYSVNR